MKHDASRSDDQGRAFAGSQLQVQIYVARRQAELSRAVAAAIGDEALAKLIRWTAPMEAKAFAEPQDGAFLDAVGLSAYRRGLRAFWPKGGPHWDALAIVPGSPHPQMVILAEAKSYPEEVYGPGCMAKAKSSIALINQALGQTRAWLHPSEGANWTGRLYQYANRLAHLYFIREAVGVQAWLVNLCFVNDTTTKPTSEAGWRVAFPAFKRELGFADGKIPWVADVLLPARDRAELVAGNEERNSP